LTITNTVDKVAITNSSAIENQNFLKDAHEIKRIRQSR